ncbi:NDR1/HIN1-like protein 6 [Nicotiana tomentosiformis]|uniref:NDR1/HIN1-like protein 6 n=1 Tax=Nicotiana tomentosiformis TaxID=4098 RepID=UPI00051B2EB2|nr:NDR1/HIN1-like protein 6 [Nicotiana tomentosiformis]
MADHQRIHPVPEPEQEPPPVQKPTVPLVPRGSFRSEKGDPERQQLEPPLRRRTIPYYPPLKPPKKRICSCKRCLCCTCCLLFLLIIIIGALAAAFYFVFQPKIPNYSVDSMRITQFNFNNDMSLLFATFNVNITARNPNKKIGIYYESGSHLSVWYTGVKLCEGSLPKFYQGHRNTTVLSLNLSGQTENASELLQSLQVDQQKGSIPLNLRAKVPVKLKIGKLKLMKWKFLVKCRLDVDSLSANNAIRIRNSDCKFGFRL